MERNVEMTREGKFTYVREESEERAALAAMLKGTPMPKGVVVAQALTPYGGHEEVKLGWASGDEFELIDGTRITEADAARLARESKHVTLFSELPGGKGADCVSFDPKDYLTAKARGLVSRRTLN